MSDIGLDSEVAIETSGDLRLVAARADRRLEVQTSVVVLHADGDSILPIAVWLDESWEARPLPTGNESCDSLVPF